VSLLLAGWWVTGWIVKRGWPQISDITGRAARQVR
jgi:hypothetical protein